MKFKKYSYLLALAILVSACGSTPATSTPEHSQIDIQGTAVALASTFIAQTQAALPSPEPPTSTSTPAPTNTVEPTTMPTEILLPTETFTVTPPPTAVAGDCNKPLTSWQGETATFTVVNETKPQGTVTLMMSVLTPLGECGWLNIYSTTFSGPVGSYSAGAFVDGPKDFRVFGAFQIQRGGWKIIVRNSVIVAQGGCYPNC